MQPDQTHQNPASPTTWRHWATAAVIAAVLLAVSAACDADARPAPAPAPVPSEGAAGGTNGGDSMNRRTGTYRKRYRRGHPPHQAPTWQHSTAPTHRYAGHCPATGKNQYESRKHARRAARVLYPDAVLRAYQCTECDWWHIGNTPRDVVRGERAPRVREAGRG